MNEAALKAEKESPCSTPGPGKWKFGEIIEEGKTFFEARAKAARALGVDAMSLTGVRQRTPEEEREWLAAVVELEETRGPIVPGGAQGGPPKRRR
jgi:hypothetical protein